MNTFRSTVAKFIFSSLIAISPIQAVTAASIGSSGSFVKVEHVTMGQAKIVKEGKRNYLELSKDFKTSSDGPDLKVILFNQKNIPQSIKGKPYLKLGALKSYSGKQRYLIPSNVNLSKIQTVGIYCEKYDATFAFAPLK